MTDDPAEDQAADPAGGRDIPGPRRWQVLRAIAAPASSVLVVLVTLTYLAGHRFDWWAVVIAAAVLAVCTFWLDRTLHTEVVSHVGARHPSQRRATVALGIVAVGVALVVLGSKERVVVLGLHVTVSGLLFIGLALAVIGAAGLLSELRMVGNGHLGWIKVLFGLAALSAAAAAVSSHETWWWLVAVAVVLGEIATEALSERVSGWEGLDGGRRLAAAGIGLSVVAAASIVLVAIGLHPVHLAVLLVLLLGASWVAASDNDTALVVIPILVLMLLWSTAPRGDDRDPDFEAIPNVPYTLVLGDSYSSGEGAQRYVTGTNTVIEDEQRHDNQCRQATTAWPWLLAADAPEGYPDRVLFEACSGATSENISQERALDPAKSRRRGTAELALAAADIEAQELDPPTLIILGVGGNDVGFSTIGTSCVAPGSCLEIADRWDRGEPGYRPVEGDGPTIDRMEPLSGLADDLDRAYDRVARDFPGVPVVVTPYPRPVKPDGTCLTVALGRDERAYVDRFVQELNAVVKATARRHGFHYLEPLATSLMPSDEAEGKRLCDGWRGSGINFVGLNPKAGTLADVLDPTSWTHNSVHPNETGHDAMYRAARAWFAAQGELRPGTPDRDAALPDTAIDLVRPERCGPDGDRSCPSEGAWVAGQAQALFRQAWIPLAAVLVGWWLVLLWLRPWVAHRRIWNPLRRRFPGLLDPTPASARASTVTVGGNGVEGSA